MDIIFRANSIDKLVPYTDLDWAGFKDKKRSTSGYTFILLGGLLSQQSKQQLTVALSSTKAEYITTTKAERKPYWIAQFLAALKYRLFDQQVSLKADNRRAILLTTNPKFYRRIKHIEV